MTTNLTIKCLKCKHKIEQAHPYYKTESKKWDKHWNGYFHSRNPYAVYSLGFVGRKYIIHNKTCFCGCKNPEV